MISVAFTRPERRLPASVAMAERMGFKVFAERSLDVIPGREEDFREARERISSGRVDICVLSSATAAEECIRAWGEETAGLLGLTETIPIGPGTAEALERNGIRTDGLPGTYSSQGLVDHLSGRAEGRRILLIRSDKGSDILGEGLRSAGAEVTELTAYRLERAPASPELMDIFRASAAGSIDVLAFTSPLSAVSFFETAEKEGYPKERVAGPPALAAIGGPTAEALRSLGLDADIVPKESTFGSLLEAIKDNKETER